MRLKNHNMQMIGALQEDVYLQMMSYLPQAVGVEFVKFGVSQTAQ